MINKTSSLCGFALAIAMPVFADTAETPPGADTWQPEAGDSIVFDVTRNGNEFGTHMVSFDSNEAGDLVARIDVELRAGLGPITVFRYELEATETWREGRLFALEGAVNNDGSRGRVTARRDGEALSVSGTEFDGMVDGDIITASHWNIAQMRTDRILSTEDGEIIEVSVSEQGRETLIIDGQSIETTRYLMDSDIDVTLWYDDQGRWLKLAFEARGQNIEYVLRDLYS